MWTMVSLKHRVGRPLRWLALFSIMSLVCVPVASPQVDVTPVSSLPDPFGAQSIEGARASTSTPMADMDEPDADDSTAIRSRSSSRGTGAQQLRVRFSRSVYGAVATVSSSQEIRFSVIRTSRGVAVSIRGKVSVATGSVASEGIQVGWRPERGAGGVQHTVIDFIGEDLAITWSPSGGNRQVEFFVSKKAQSRPQPAAARPAPVSPSPAQRPAVTTKSAAPKPVPAAKPAPTTRADDLDPMGISFTAPTEPVQPPVKADTIQAPDARSYEDQTSLVDPRSFTPGITPRVQNDLRGAVGTQTNRTPIVQVGIPPLPTSTPKEEVQRVVSFRHMGADADVIRFTGIDTERELSIGLARTEQPIAAQMRFWLSWSPALVPQLSQLRVMMDGRTIAIIRLANERTLNQQVVIPIDTRRMGQYTKFKFKFIGHYRAECEDPASSVLWAEVADGQLITRIRRAEGARDLALLPEPFVPLWKGGPVKLQFVLAPTPESIRAASTIAGYFGSRAEYRDIRCDVSLQRLPNGNSILIARRDYLPPFLQGLPSDQPLLAMVPHPNDKAHTVLVVTGPNDEALMKAACALAFADQALSGTQATVLEQMIPAPRRPYDAPKWLPTNRPVRFSDIAGNNTLTQSGLRGFAVSVPLRMPPDLFLWNTRGIPVYLSYRYTPGRANTNSRLDVLADDRLIQSFPLLTQWQTASEARAQSRPPYSDFQRTRTFYIPPDLANPPASRLQFSFAFDYTRENPCVDFPFTDFQGRIDGSSTIDLTGIPHFVRMPELSLFARYGYPFSIMADLSDTQVMMPRDPSATCVATLLEFAIRHGAYTGHPPIRMELSMGASPSAGKHILVIADDKGSCIPAEWHSVMPLRLTSDGFELKDLNRDDMSGDREGSLQREELGQLLDRQDGRLGVMVSFGTPGRQKRVVVALLATDSEQLRAVADILANPDRRGEVQRDTVAVVGPMEKPGPLVKSARLAEPFYLGKLPALTQTRWWLSQRPLVWAISIVVLILIAVFTARLWRRLRERARAAAMSGGS